MSFLRVLAAATALSLSAGGASAQTTPATKVVIGFSGWTGFAPLTLAKEAGIFAKNGLDVTLKKIPQKDRHLAIASGDIQCAATTVETWAVWAASGIETRQIFQMDRSNGADGMAVRNGIASIKDLKGKTIGASAPGTAPYFTLAWMLKKNGLSPKDVTIVNLEPGPAAQAFVAGQNDAAVTYEPYLSTVRAKPEAGKILVTSVDYPVVVDTLVFRTDFIKKNPKIVKASVDSFFEALDMIKKEPAKAYELMGSAVKQTGEQFGKSAQFISWQDRAANKAYYAKEHQQFTTFAIDVLKFNRVVAKDIKPKDMVDLGFQ